jgi:hypothetical protein
MKNNVYQGNTGVLVDFCFLPVLPVVQDRKIYYRNGILVFPTDISNIYSGVNNMILEKLQL